MSQLILRCICCRAHSSLINCKGEDRFACFILLIYQSEIEKLVSAPISKSALKCVDFHSDANLMDCFFNTRSIPAKNVCPVN